MTLSMVLTTDYFIRSFQILSCYCTHAFRVSCSRGNIFCQNMGKTEEDLLSQSLVSDTKLKIGIHHIGRHRVDYKSLEPPRYSLALCLFSNG